MKRLLLLGLILVLLTGCHADAGDGTEETAETLAPTLYMADSKIEQDTAGAVRQYSLEDGYQSSLTFMGQKLLLRSSSDMLTALTGSEAELVATYQMGITSALYTGQTGIAYYRTYDNCIVTCNAMLQQTGEIALPAEISGKPVVNLAKKEVYYCVDLEILAMDMSTGISRLLKEFSAGVPKITGSLFEGAILVCQVSENETHYISSATGQTLSKDSNITSIITDANHYFLNRTDGGVRQMIYGALDATPGSFLLTEENVGVLGIPQMNGALTYLESDGALTLSFYDFSTGKKTASVQIPGVKALKSAASNGQGIWVLAQQGDTQVLLRWDTSLSPVQDSATYTGALYTAASPDTAGLSQCQKKADSLNKAYGLRFRLNQDALKVTGGYSFKPEYQVATINAFLDTLSPVLAQFPDGFWSKTLRSGRIYIGLVREIAGESDYVLYHKDGNAYIVFAYGANVAECLYDATGYLVDSFVLGNSRDYDDWNLLNPDGFVYGDTVSATHLTESARYFIDEQATKSPRDDRQRIFAYAMQADKANYFSTPAMQDKLRLVCEAIREAYGLEKKKVAYTWEQHLTDPIYKP